MLLPLMTPPRTYNWKGLGIALFYRSRWLILDIVCVTINSCSNILNVTVVTIVIGEIKCMDVGADTTAPAGTDTAGAGGDYEV